MIDETLFTILVIAALILVAAFILREKRVRFWLTNLMIVSGTGGIFFSIYGSLGMLTVTQPPLNWLMMAILPVLIMFSLLWSNKHAYNM